MKIRADEKIALVGNNGAGKTTIVKLLCGLYPPTSGEILIDGKSIDDIGVEKYQDMVSVHFVLLELTVLFFFVCNVCVNAAYTLVDVCAHLILIIYRMHEHRHTRRTERLKTVRAVFGKSVPESHTDKLAAPRK